MENQLITKKHTFTPFTKQHVQSLDLFDLLLTWPSYYF